jgi:hypothetical protein
MNVHYDDERDEDELEAEAAGTTMVLTDTGWEGSDHVEPGDDWRPLADGSWVSPDERIRTWPFAGPVDR